MAGRKKPKRRKPRAAGASARRAASRAGAQGRSAASQPPLDDELAADLSSDPPAVSADAEISLDADVDVDVEVVAGDEPERDPAADEPISRPPSSLAVLFHEVTDDEARWESEPGKKLSELRDEATKRSGAGPRSEKRQPARTHELKPPPGESWAEPAGAVHQTKAAATERRRAPRRAGEQRAAPESAPGQPNYGRAALLIAGLLAAGFAGAFLSRIFDDRPLAPPPTRVVPGPATAGSGQRASDRRAGVGLADGLPPSADADSTAASPLPPGTVPRPLDAGAGPADGDAGGAIDEAAVRQALERSARAATQCPAISEGSPASVTVAVTFAPNGRASNAKLTGGPLVGTYTGNCITQAFLRARVPAFTGDFATFEKTVRLR